jgi:NAD(P)-dependent dehydrogenase (short-subunit alcohol dehydrogenase family)
VHVLEDAGVLVIGGSSGIGLATARLAAEQGARVAIAARDAARLARAREELGAQVQAFQADAEDEDSLRALFERVGPLDHVLSTAGAVVHAPRLEGELAALRAFSDRRVSAAIHVARQAAPRLRAHGSITFLSGTAATRPHAGGALDSAACAAIEGLTRALAFELAPLRVNALRPGAVDTPLLASALGDARDAFLAQAARALPVGRVGRPEDVAQAALFLMSCGYVTGIALCVDGGHGLVSQG